MSNTRESNCCGITDRKCPNTKTVDAKSLAGMLKRDEIVSHVAAFGDVENVRICPFVENTQAESVAMEVEFHTIAQRSVDGRHQGETTFLDLNDDCIHGILSTECLSALDLCSVAETSRRLKQIAVRVFRIKHGKCDISALANRKVRPAQRILRNFGAVISDLKLCGHSFINICTSVLKSVARHCSSTLESLHLRECVIPDSFPAKLIPIFNNLQKLKIDGSRFDGASKKLLADCGSLVELEIFNSSVVFVVENTFPKLQKFESGYGGVAGIHFDSFILRHKNLTSFLIHNYLGKSLLPIIANNCKQLEGLQFSIHGDQTYDLSNLGNLRKLDIMCDYRNVNKVVRGWNNLQFLENLTLRWANLDPDDPDEFIKTLSLKRLQVLKLLDCDGFDNLHRVGDLNQLTELEIASNGIVDLDFVALIERLSNLKVLNVIGRGFKMHLETYLRIVDVVRARPEKSKLTFKFDCLDRLQWFDAEADMLHSFSLNAHIVEMIITGSNAYF